MKIVVGVSPYEFVSELTDEPGDLKAARERMLRYIERFEAALQARFPSADIEIRTGDPAPDMYVLMADGSDAPDNIRRHVEDIANEIYATPEVWG